MNLIKCKFQVIGLSEHKIGSNSSINLCCYTFSYDRAKIIHDGTDFVVYEKNSIKKHEDFNISVGLTFIQVNVPKSICLKLYL